MTVPGKLATSCHEVWLALSLIRCGIPLYSHPCHPFLESNKKTRLIKDLKNGGNGGNGGYPRMGCCAQIF